MKLVELTNSTVVPFFKNNKGDPDEIVRTTDVGETKMVSFMVRTRITDNSVKRSYLYERCTIFAKTNKNTQDAIDVIKDGAIVAIKGYENSYKSNKDGKYYRSIKVLTVNLISEGGRNNEHIIGDVEKLSGEDQSES